MTIHVADGPPSPSYPEDGAGVPTDYSGSEYFGVPDLDPDDPVRPVNWNLLPADEALAEWADLDAWVDWLRRSFGLPASVLPPLWHRHDELVWELSALHTHWLNAYDPEGSPSGPIGWMRDFADTRHRLREWVSTAGCRLDRDRSTRQTVWPGEDPIDPMPEEAIVDRKADFKRFVYDDVAARRRLEERAREQDCTFS